MQSRQKSFSEVSESLSLMIHLAKSFPGLVLPEWFKEGLKTAMGVVIANGEHHAVRELVSLETGLHNLITSFFRNSPKFFEARIREFEGHDYEQDILACLNKRLRAISVMSRSEEIDLATAQVVYSELYELLGWARDEMNRRITKRRENERKAEELAAQKRADEQRQLELQLRQEKADIISSLLEAAI